MRIIVTGADGLIGRHLTAKLRTGHEVWPITRSQTALPQSADAVVHLAQSPHYRDFPAQALDVFDVNLALTTRLLDWSRTAGVRHFILASTGGVDQMSAAPSYYVVTKASAEQFARCYEKEFGVLVLRFYFVYGPGQRASMLVPRLIGQIRDGQPIQLAGPDGARLNPTYVEDAAAALEAALERRVAGTIPIAGPEVVSIRTMAETIASALGTTARFTVDAAQPPQDLIGDITEMSSRLAAPRWSFASGIGEMMR